VAEASKQPASPRLGTGWAELREGRWDAAMTFFERAAATEETPEAFEGLSWAAWWLDRPEVLFEARERAYRLYRKRGDAAGAARMATWLASDQLDFHGAFAVASGWLARAHRLLDPLEPSPDHGWLAFLEGYLAHGSGETAKAAELARSAAELGRRFGVPDLEMLGLALQGATLVARARMEEGMRCLDEATATALEGEAAIPISSAWACCFMVSSCAAVRDFERAFEWSDRIAEFAERYGSRYMLAFCRAEYGTVHLWRGRWQEAERVLEDSVEDFSRSRPPMVGAPLVGWPSCDAGRAGGRKRHRCWTGRGPPRRRGSAGPAWRWTRARPSGPSNWSSGCCASCPQTPGWTAPRRSSCSSTRGRRAASWRMPAPRSRPSGRSSG
jgi:LuxR family maltose regulon positive regulatory protein